MNHASASSGRTVRTCLRALIRQRVIAAEKGSRCLDHPAMVLRQTITMPQGMIQRLEGRRRPQRHGQPVIREGKRGVELGGAPKSLLCLRVSSHPVFTLALRGRL